jgi:hypothetical protein
MTPSPSVLLMHEFAHSLREDDRVVDESIWAKVGADTMLWFPTKWERRLEYKKIVHDLRCKFEPERTKQFFHIARFGRNLTWIIQWSTAQ